MHLTGNKARINLPWYLCEAFWNGLVFVPEGALILHFCWPLCPFPHKHIAPIEMITAFQSMVKTTRHFFFRKPQWLLKHLTTVSGGINHGQLSIRLQAEGLLEMKLNAARGQSRVTWLLVGSLYYLIYWFNKQIELCYDIVLQMCRCTFCIVAGSNWNLHWRS